jgi:methionyl-tRNA formyltransferase
MYRGAAPIQWALLNSERITGITTMLIDKGLDTGDILLKSEIEIQDDDNAETLSKKLSEFGARTLIETIKGMRQGKIKPVPQIGEATYAPPLKKDDGRINWQRTAEDLFNFVRGMYPWPSAFCYLNNERIKIIKVRRLKNSDELRVKSHELGSEVNPGRIVKVSDGGMIVETGKGFLVIEELQPEGKKVMSAKAFLGGRKLSEGNERFS